MNLHLPAGARPPQGGLVMNELKIEVQRIEADVVAGSVVLLGIRQTGASEATASLVSVGGVSKLEYLAAKLMPFYLEVHDVEHSVEQALKAAEALIRKVKERSV